MKQSRRLQPVPSSFARRFFLGAVGASLFIVASAASAQYDLRASFVEGNQIQCQRAGRGCAPVSISIDFKNNGPNPSKATTVSLNQFNGRRASGYAVRFGGSGALERLPELQAGETTRLTWTSRGVTAGQYTFKPRYSSPINDTDNNNHNVQQTINISYISNSSSSSSSGSSYPSNSGSSSSGSSSSSSSSGSGFDVQAQFPYQGTVQCQTELNQINQLQCVSLQIQVLFKNNGPNASTQRRVSLNKYNGTTAYGYAQRFGGSGAFQTLPPLQPGEEVTLTWSSNAVPLGQYTFRPMYSGPLNDNDNSNHAITQTLQVVQ